MGVVTSVLALAGALAGRSYLDEKKSGWGIRLRRVRLHDQESQGHPRSAQLRLHAVQELLCFLIWHWCSTEHVKDVPAVALSSASFAPKSYALFRMPAVGAVDASEFVQRRLACREGVYRVFAAQVSHY